MLRNAFVAMVTNLEHHNAFHFGMGNKNVCYLDFIGIVFYGEMMKMLFHVTTHSLTFGCHGNINLEHNIISSF